MGRVVSVVINPRHRKTLAEATLAVSSVVDCSTNFPDPASYVPIVEGEVVEEASPSNLRDFTSKNDCGISAL